MPSENLSVAKVLSVLAWIVLGVGVVGIALVFFLTPTFTAATIISLIIGLFGVLIAFVTLNVLARILKTVTYLYQLSWEQFKELGDNIDELDGKYDGTDGAQCPFCGALIDPQADGVCKRCGKKLESQPEKRSE